MFDWIAGFVARWAASVPAAVRDLVHWSVHALAGVVYAVFGNVGGAWHKLFTALHWLYTSGYDLAKWLVTHISYLVKVWLPRLEAAITAAWRDALAFASRLYHDVLGRLDQLTRLARRWVDDAIAWVVTHVLDPLAADARQLRADLLKWGYFAYQLVTHPDRLAAIVGDALIAWAESQFWRLAGPVGQFVLRLLLANARKFAQLLETIVTAVL